MADRVEDLTAGATAVLGRRVEEDTDVSTRVGQGMKVLAQHLSGAGRGRGEPGEDAHRGRLACPIRAEEAGDPARLSREGHIVDGDEVSVSPSEVRRGDHEDNTGRLEPGAHQPTVCDHALLLTVVCRGPPILSADVSATGTAYAHWVRRAIPATTVWGETWRLAWRRWSVAGPRGLLLHRRPQPVAVGSSTHWPG